MPDQRKTSEQRFYDRAYESGTVDTKNGFFEISAGVQRYRQLILAGCDGKRALEYGCGLGGQAFALAERGATVTGIDISEVAVAQARRRAAAIPAASLRFLKADAEALEFPDGSFDLVCGSGILHHLDLDRSLRELHRVLVPGGRGVFYEPLGHNPLLNLYRVMTPGSHTPDEHPLLMREIRGLQNIFATARAEFYDLLSVFVIPILSLPGGEKLLRASEWADRQIFRFLPPLRAWGAVVVLELGK
ncbi:MAG TPA: class I SAM-dependent methyltransferase [Thermoanaerobaculia bacterium]|nr:class I SAM-dependent methyltransferase [Thermoanaerobaculia bacterium]